MATLNKPWMMFVDGENLTIRADELAIKQGIDITDPSIFNLYKKSTYFWPMYFPVKSFLWQGAMHVHSCPERCYYYTSAQGNESEVNMIHDKLASRGFSPVVLRKRSNQRKSKGVDISLTKDMLVQAFMHNYDIAVLIAGDGDYCPVVEEIKRLGKWVIVCFFDDENGLNPKLRRAADQYERLELFRDTPQPPRKLTLPPPERAIINVNVPADLKSRLEQIAGSRTPTVSIADEAVIAIKRYVEQEETKGAVPPVPGS